MKADCGLCRRLGRSCHWHPEETSQSVTGVSLTADQLRGVEALASRGTDETMDEVAQRAGVSRRTLWRWQALDAFKIELRRRIEIDLGSHRARVARALIAGACTPGPGQAGMQKLYWQRLGELDEKATVDHRWPPPVGEHEPETLEEARRLLETIQGSRHKETVH